MLPHVDGQVGAAEVLGLALATTESLPVRVVCCHVDLESRAADESLASTTLLGAIVGSLAGVPTAVHCCKWQVWSLSQLYSVEIVTIKNR